MDFFDYSPAANGMTYRNNLNPSGVPINGIPDSPVAGAPTWEQVTGAPGVAHDGRLDLDELHARRGDVVLPRRHDAAGHPVHR